MTITSKSFAFVLLLSDAITLTGCFGIASWGGSAVAQNIPVADTTLGSENSTVTPINPTVDQINGGATRGANLFHSFQEFNVGDGRAVYFINPAGIQNILTRVTGTNASNIFGTLGVTGGNANLFLINPNGIVFGQNARLDVGGSFVATTANAIGLANGDIFSANTSVPLPSQLLNVNPNAFFFNQMAAQSITSQARLQVPDGESLLLVGGNVSLNGGQLLARGGRVELGGLADTGTVGLSVNGNDLRLSFPPQVTRSNVSLDNGAEVNVRFRGVGSGSIAINAQNLNMAGGSILRAGIESGGLPSTQAGDIGINATGAVNLTNGSFISNALFENNEGKGGNVNITAESLSVTSGASINATTYGRGDGGGVNINARNTVSFDGRGNNTRFFTGASSSVEAGAEGNAGGINITTGSLSMTNGALLYTSTFGRGDAGSVTINAHDTVLFDGVSSNQRSSSVFSTVESTGEGKAGGVNITAGSLSMTNGAFLRASTYGKGDAGSVNITVGSLRVTNGAFLDASTGGRGDAGSLNIFARDTVSFDGVGRNGGSCAACSIVGTAGVGKGGDINITTGSLSMTNGAVLSTTTFGKGNAGSVTINARDTVSFDRASSASSTVGYAGVGNGGSINITAESLSVTNGAQLLVSTFGQGNAGNVNIVARNTVLFDGMGSNSYTGAYSTVGYAGVGNGGGVNITTGSLTVANSAELVGSTFGRGNAGSVTINARDTVSFRAGFASGTVQKGAVGNGGNVNITTGSLSVTNGAALTGSTSGQGNAGSVNIFARDTVSFDRVGTAYSTVGDGAVGKGGSINITAESLSVTNGAQLLASTFGQGNAGNVNILARDTVLFDGTGSNRFTGAYSTVGYAGLGNGGGVSITTGSLRVTNGARLIASTFGQGDAGSVNILTRDTVLFDGVGNDGLASAAFSNVESTGTGKGGSVNITTGSLAVTNGAYLSARTFNRGDAGSVTINARDTVTIDGLGNRKSIRGVAESSAVLVESTGEGNGGDINITTGLLAVTNSAYLRASTYGKGDAGSVNITVGSLRVTNGAFLDASTGGRGDAGSVNIFARDTVFLDGVGINGGSCAVCSIVGTAGVGKGGGINITTGSLFVTNGALLSATTYGKGDAGNIVLNVADSINLSGVNSRGFSSGLLTGTESTASGQGGDIRVATGALRVSDGAVLSARTFNDKSGGNIIVNANTVELTNGGQFLTTAYSSGRAGNISVNATDRITISGTDPTFTDRLAKFGRPTVDPAGSASGFFANTDPNSTGNGGSISINTPQLNITDGAGIAVNSEGKGNGGELLIQSDTLTLARQAFLSAATASGEGGNMTLQVQDLLLMRHGSLISTEAGNNGNGGNMNINAKFIVAVPKEDSDIVANAERGRGGNINITTQGIYGLQYRPQRTPLSDITASSQFGINGTVQINSLDVDPSRGLANLPENLVDTSALIANSCIARSSQQDSSFTITGRGGLPTRPGDPFTSPYPTGTVRSLPSSSASSDTPGSDLEVTNPERSQQRRVTEPIDRTRQSTQAQNHPDAGSSHTPTPPTPARLVEASGWVYGANGEVILTAQSPTVTPHSSWSTLPTCPE